MPRTRAPRDHSEYGGGPGIIDPVRRADRAIGQAVGVAGEELMEIYATDPNLADENLAEVEIGRLRR